AFHSSCEVDNFPMKDHTAMELEELNRVEAIRKMEKADTVVCIRQLYNADSKG
ncbi:cilia- and flagella-associated protein 43-like, partial [Tachysurus ichikawai]